jgi:hypothetical protein
MKKLKYQIKCGDSIYDVVMDYSEANEEIAKREAYNGKYSIEEVG